MKLSMRLPRHFINAPSEEETTETGIQIDTQADKPPPDQISRVQSFCRYTALLHLAAAVSYLIVTIAQDLGEITIPRLKTPITRNIAIWINASEQVVMNTTAVSSRLDLNQCPLATPPPAKDSAYIVQQLVLDANKYELDTRALIIAFHMLSFIFQALLGYSASYSVQLERGYANYSHFIEYSISASVLLMAMAAQAMITDIFLITSIVANCTGCMVLGLMAEILYEYRAKFSVALLYQSQNIAPENKKDSGMNFSAHWVAHFAGWFLIVVAMIATNSNLISMKICAGAEGMTPPAFVAYLVGGEIACFMCFGFVQMYSFITRESADQLDKEEDRNKRKRQIAYNAEFIYILLSATAKLYLGLIVFVGNYTNK